jgi:hypothetical protein
MTSTRQDKEKLVLDLYYNQNKSYHQIAREARICPRDIKTILNKVIKGKESQEFVYVSSQAYKFFSEGKTPIGVAIALNLRETDVAQLYKEYWTLCHLHDLTRVYVEIKGDIVSFLHLYKLAKSAGMNAQQVIRLLNIANNHLPSVEQKCEKLKREVYSLEGDKRNSTMILQELSDQISDLRNTSDSCRLSCEQEKRQMAELHQKKMKLETLVNDFQDNNEEYLKVITNVGEEVLSGLSNVKMFLRYALLSITESMRNNPERYRSIFYNMSSITDYSSSNGQNYMYGQQQQQNSSPDYDTEANAAIIISEAEKLFYKLVKDSINKIITDCTFSKSPLPSSFPMLPPSNEQQQSHMGSRPIAAAAAVNQTRTCREENTFIQPEIDNEEQDN